MSKKIVVYTDCDVIMAVSNIVAAILVASNLNHSIAV